MLSEKLHCFPIPARHCQEILHETALPPGAVDCRPDREYALSAAHVEAADSPAAGVAAVARSPTGGMLYALNHEGPFYRLEVRPDGFEIVSQFRLLKKGRGPYISHPVICGGRLYVRYDAYLYCYDIRATKGD